MTSQHANLTDTAQSTDRPYTPGEIQGNLEASLKEQFSSERFERAMSTLDRYGPEEGLRRLRENDPEVAKQIEQHQNRSRSSLPRSIGEDSDKSEEVSQMKVFMITWGLFCFLVIVGLFIAYATDQFARCSYDPQQIELEAEEECSPCEENLKQLKEAMERWERERKAQAIDRGDTE